MKFIWKTLGLIRRFATSLMFIAMFVVFMASHTITSLAALTNTVIEAVSGVTTVAADALTGKAALKRELEVARKKSAAKVANLETELVASQRQNGKLSAAQKRSKAKIAALEADLSKANGANIVTFKGQKMTARQASMKFAKGVQMRTSKVAKANVASVAGESIPFWGIAVIVTASTYELNASCQSMKDAYELQVALDPSAKISDDRQEVCGLKVPSKDEVWEKVLDSPSAAWEASLKAYEETSNALASVEMPNFSRGWATAMNWISSWGE